MVTISSSKQYSKQRPLPHKLQGKETKDFRDGPRDSGMRGAWRAPDAARGARKFLLRVVGRMGASRQKEGGLSRHRTGLRTHTGSGS